MCLPFPRSAVSVVSSAVLVRVWSAAAAAVGAAASAPARVVPAHADAPPKRTEVDPRSSPGQADPGLDDDLNAVDEVRVEYDIIGPGKGHPIVREVSRDRFLPKVDSTAERPDLPTPGANRH